MRKRILAAVAVLCVAALTLGAESVKRGGVLKATSNTQGVLVRNFNPFSPASLEAANGCIYESLIYFNNVNATANPWLAEKWAWSKDLKSVTFTIRKGVKFNDGSPMTVDDVYFSLMLGQSNKALDTSGIWAEGLQSVKVAGDTVTCTFANVNVTALEKFGNLYIVPKAIWSKVADPVNFTNGDNPVGTGPFMLDPASFGEQSYKVLHNPLYWQKAPDGQPLPYIDAVQYMTTTNEQVGFNLISNAYDWANYLVTNIDDYVKADPANHKYWFGQGNLVYLYMNNLKAPFDNVNVRKAIAMGISQRDITRKMVPSPVPADQSAVKSNFAEIAKQGLAKYAIKHDVNGAKKLLESQGYRLNGQGIYEKDGQALSFKVVVPADWTDWVGAAQTVSSQLKDIGVEAIVSQETWPDPFQSNLELGNTDMAFNIGATGSNPYFEFNRLLNSTNFAPIGTRNHAYWNMRYKNADIDANLAAYRRELSPVKQKEYMSAIVEQFMKDTPAVPLFFNPNWYEYNTTTFVGWPSEENPYAWPSTVGMQKEPILLNVHLK